MKLTRLMALVMSIALTQRSLSFVPVAAQMEAFPPRVGIRAGWWKATARHRFPTRAFG